MTSTKHGGRAWARTVAHVVRRDHGICHICGQPGADSADHLVPKSKGGTDHPRNLRAAHHVNPPHCNRYRNNWRTPEETLERVTALGLLDTPDDLTW